VFTPLITLIGDMPLKSKILFHLKRPLFLEFRRARKNPPETCTDSIITYHLRRMQNHKLPVSLPVCQLLRKLPVSQQRHMLQELLQVCQLHHMQYHMQMLPS
jgi:hypothetical protein